MASAVMKQVDAAEYDEGAVIWEAVCFITPLSCQEGTTHTHTHTRKSAVDRKGREKRENKSEGVK